MEAACVVAAVIENAASGPRGEPGSDDIFQRDLPPSNDDQSRDAALLPRDPDDVPAEEREPEGTSTARVRSDDITEHPAEPLLRSCLSTASMKVKNMKKLTFPRGHFPRLAECAHFHYENVDFGNVQLAFAEGQSEGPKVGLDSKELLFLVQITCQGRNWLVKRSYEDFRVLDKHLHLCIYDRRYSELSELPRYDTVQDTVESVTRMLATYLSRFSSIADNKINCGPVLTWMEIDNKGNHLLVSEEASINVPAIAAAHVTKRYTAQATDELTFEVGDIVSVIDMPPKEDTGWWRGKHGFQVGFFPCDCVELINDKLPPSVQSSVPKPVCKKHGKLVTFLRTFMKSRPPPQKLRQRGILKERVFGCDLGEHLHSSEHEAHHDSLHAVPQVVKSCTEFIEKHGVVDGIYRLSGISSNIQKLRHEFDSEQIPDLTRDVFRQDIHSVGSLCKLYFRELPNPLLTYQLYDRFSEAVSAATDEERLVKIHNVIQQLPPPHYRTLEYLMRHLSHLATFSSTTNMHTKNLAIVWAPNLLRSRQIESACFSGTAAFMEVRIQSVVVEFILNNTEALFSLKLNAIIRESTGNNTLSRPKSLLVCSPSTKLLSLEEAQARTQAQLGSPATTPCLSHSDYIEVGEGPGALVGKFHTVIDLPMESNKRPPAKAKKSPVGNWLSFFHLGKSQSVSKRKLKRHPSEPNEIKSIALPGGRGDTGTLRSTKSEESLTSLHNLEAESSAYCPRRPRSTSEAVSLVGRDDLRRSQSKEGQRGHPPRDAYRSPDSIHSVTSLSPQQPDEELDLCPPAAGISSLDFDPMSFQCSQPSATPRLQQQQQHRERGKWRKSAGCSSESEPISSPNNNNNISRTQSPDISPGLCQDECDALLEESRAARAAHLCRSPLSSASQASALTDRTQSAQNLPDPGTDRLMSSVSVLPPHPPSMSAARKLALALAESAHRASSGSQRRADVQRAGPQDERPPRPSVLDLKVYPQEPLAPRGLSVLPHQWHRPAPESHCCPRPPHFLQPRLGSGSSQLTDGQESACNFTPNVSPLGSGSLDEGSDRREDRELLAGDAEPACQSIGVSTPTQLACSAQSPVTSPVYVNTDSINIFNFRAVLAETAMPASVEEVLPRPAQAPSARHYSPEEVGSPGLDQDVYVHPRQRNRAPSQSHCPRPDVLPHLLFGPRGLYRQSSESRHSTLGLRQPLSPQCRRYRRDELLVGGRQRQQGPWQRAEDRFAGQPGIRRARSFHAPQYSRYGPLEAEMLPLDPVFYVERRSGQESPYRRFVQSGMQPAQQFENTRPSYRYNPYSGINPADGGRYPEVEPSDVRHRESYRGGGRADYYNFSPRRVPPVSRELYVENRDGDFYEGRDVEVLERMVYHPAKHENAPRCKDTFPTASPSLSPVSPMDSRNRDIAHTRSKSDPGNACLLSANRSENRNAALAVSPTSQGPRQPELDVSRRHYGHPTGEDLGPPRRIQIKQNPPLRKVPSLPERGCPNLKSTEHNNRSHTRSHEQERLMMAGGGGGGGGGGYSGVAKPGILRRAGRSQSTRENRHHYHQHAQSPLDPQHLGTFSSQHTRRTQSTKVRPTQYDHMEGYYAVPKPKPSRSGNAASGYLPGQGCMSPRGHRLLSKALGHEALHQAALLSEAGAFD